MSQRFWSHTTRQLDFLKIDESKEDIQKEDIENICEFDFLQMKSNGLSSESKNKNKSKRLLFGIELYNIYQFREQSDKKPISKLDFRFFQFKIIEEPLSEN